MTIKAAFMVPHPPMIVPAVGRGSEEQIRETTAAYEKVAEEIAALAPETIVIISPHTVAYTDYFHISPGEGAKGSFAQFAAPQVKFNVDYDVELVSEICRIGEEKGFPAGTLGERDKKLDHGTMVPLWFIDGAAAESYKIIRVGLSGLSLKEHYRFGQIIRQAVEKLGRNTVIVASGDLSHKLKESGPYGFAEEGPEYDERLMDVCRRAAFEELLEFPDELCDKAAECGHRSFVIMAGALDGMDVDAKVLSHQDVTGVGYGICTFYPGKSDDYVRLAKKSIESYVLRGERMEVPDDLPAEIKERQAGAFVSIHKNGDLRGCIGTIGPTRDNLAEEIISNAISASVSDPRFLPIGPDELSSLQISVDVLGDAEDIESEDQLDVKRYGVIVSKGMRRGLLLPDLEGIDTVEKQIFIARQKAGIRPDEKVRLQRFEVIRHE